MTSKITTRVATRDDAAMIAQVVAMAIGDEHTLRDYCGEDYLNILTEIARSDETQYSWRYAIIAEVEGVVAGAIVGYDGAQLGELREGTFSIIRSHIGRVPTIPNETEAGEYYLDSVGVMPEFRRRGVGGKLIDSFCERAFTQGHQRVGLIVDCNNPKAEQLYTSHGFERIGTRIFFGHKMWHLVATPETATRQKPQL